MIPREVERHSIVIASAFEAFFNGFGDTNARTTWKAGPHDRK